MKTTELMTLKENNSEKDTFKLDQTKVIGTRSLRPMKSMMKIQSVKPERMTLPHKLRKKVIKF
jgi:hypothetical protein